MGQGLESAAVEVARVGEARSTFGERPGDLWDVA
jgi:hypothetical protein